MGRYSMVSIGFYDLYVCLSLFSCRPRQKAKEINNKESAYIIIIMIIIMVIQHKQMQGSPWI